MNSNYRGFFSGQGNKMPYETGFKGIVLALAFIIMLTIGLFREKIARKFDNGRKILGFKEQKNFGQTIGCVGLAFFILRIALTISQDYPLYGEILSLHLCRVHLLIMFLLMIFNKTKGIKYFTYIAIVGALFGIFFNNSHSDVINGGYENNSFGKGNRYEDLPNHGNQLEKLAYLKGVEGYATGLDNFFLYDFVFAHLTLIFLPLFIRSAYRQKISNKEFFSIQIGYVFAAIFMGIFNFAMGNISNPHGRPNMWFIGLDSNNDEFNALGALSAWPQNLFSYSFIGIAIIGLFHAIGFALAKVQFFRRDKGYQLKIVKSIPRAEFMNGFHKGGFKFQIK